MNIRSISACSLAAALSVLAISPMSAAIQDARPVSMVAPTYSLDLRQAGTEGEVVVGFTITASGDVLNPMVVSTTDRAFDKATISAVRKWKFSPATDGGVAVSQKAVLPVAFMIPELHSDATARVIVSNSTPASAARNSATAN